MLTSAQINEAATARRDEAYRSLCADLIPCKTASIAALALALVLAACDSSTGGGDSSALGLKVLTGTAEAPADTPTVRLSWGRSDTAVVSFGAHTPSGEIYKVRGRFLVGVWYAFSPADTTVQIPCADGETSAVVLADARLPSSWDSTAYADTVTVHCK